MILKYELQHKEESYFLPEMGAVMFSPSLTVVLANGTGYENQTGHPHFVDSFLIPLGKTS